LCELFSLLHPNKYAKRATFEQQSENESDEANDEGDAHARKPALH